MTTTNEDIAYMLTKAGIYTASKPVQKLYRFLPDNSYRLAVLFQNSNTWRCFQDDAYTGDLHAPESARAWVNALE